MNPLPQDTALGKLGMVEVYDYFDGPRLFTCRNEAGRYFLGIWVDEAPGTETWLYVPMSQRRFFLLRHGKFELRRALTDAEDGFVFRVKLTVRTGHSSLDAISSGSLTDDLLPEEGEYLSATGELDADLRLREIASDAQRAKRETVKLRLNIAGSDDIEAPLDVLGPILTTTQSTVSAIALTKAKQRGLNKRMVGNHEERVPESEFRSITRLYAVETFPSSFGVKLIGLNAGDLFSESLLGDALEELLTLMEMGKNAASLRERLAELKPRSARKYRDFLQSLVSTATDATVEWASPKGGPARTARLTATQAREALEAINRPEKAKTSELLVRGWFVAVHLRRRRFELKEERTSVRFTGKISVQALATASTVNLAKLYDTHIRSTTQTIPLTGEETTSLELLSLTPAQPPESGGPGVEDNRLKQRDRR